MCENCTFISDSRLLESHFLGGVRVYCAADDGGIGRYSAIVHARSIHAEMEEVIGAKLIHNLCVYIAKQLLRALVFM